jgi:hypothetical protein
MDGVATSTSWIGARVAILGERDVFRAHETDISGFGGGE